MFGAKPCPRCNRFRHRSRDLDALRGFHAECYFSPECQDDLLALKERFPVAIVRMASDLGVSPFVVRMSLDAAMRRKGMLRPRWGR